MLGDYNQKHTQQDCEVTKMGVGLKNNDLSPSSYIIPYTLTLMLEIMDLQNELTKQASPKHHQRI